MKRRFTEQTILLISVLKWIVLATAVGAIVGVAAAIFLKILSWSTAAAGGFSYYFLLLPLAFLASSLLVRYLAPDAEGHGTEKVIEAVHQRSGKIKASVVPVKLAATVVTIAAGGSAGKEGPCAQIGAGLASVFAGLLRFADADRRKLVICGISAGFASVFGTPIAGAIFGLEVLFIGSISYEVLLPSFIASIMGYQIASALGVSYFYHPLSAVPDFSGSFFLEVILAGIFFGGCSILLIGSLKAGQHLSGRLPLWPPLKGLAGGLVLIGLTLLFSQSYLGLGLDTIEAALNGESPAWYAFALKAVFTSITLAFGGSGGIVTPIFFVGSTSGAAFAQLLGLDVALFAAIGFVSVLAGAANTPIAAGIMAIELFGAEAAPYAIMAGVISFLITGHRSVYPSQMLATTKSASVAVEVGQTIEQAQPSFLPREKSLTGAFWRLRQRR